MLRLLLATAILASPSAWALPNTLPVTDGLQAWLDVGVGVFTFEGNEVIAWADISGNENDDTYNGANSFGESPPLYDSANPDIGGAASVRFNGSNALEFDLGFLVGSDYTIFVVNGRDRFELANFFIAGNSVATNQNLVLGYEAPSLLRQSHFNNDLDVTVETYNGEPVWSIDTFRFSGEDGRDIFHNGEAVASDSNTTPLLANTGTTIGHIRGE